MSRWATKYLSDRFLLILTVVTHFSFACCCCQHPSLLPYRWWQSDIKKELPESPQSPKALDFKPLCRSDNGIYLYQFLVLSFNITTGIRISVYFLFNIDQILGYFSLRGCCGRIIIRKRFIYVCLRKQALHFDISFIKSKRSRSNFPTEIQYSVIVFPTNHLFYSYWKKLNY